MRHNLTLPLLVAIALPVGTLPAQTLTITAQPVTATILRLKVADSTFVPIGTGTARLKLEKNDPNVIVVRQGGYREVRKAFPREADYKVKEITVVLDTRIVALRALPYDAAIVVNGQQRGQRELDLEVTEGQATTVEIRKRGYATVSRVYRWERGGELPPQADVLELVDRKVMVSAGPSGTEIAVDNRVIGTGDAEATIKRDACVTVRAQRAGWVPMEREYCNKDGISEPPIADRLQLSGRAVSVSAPPAARILVNQKQAGVGSYSLRIADGACTKVRIELGGYLSEEREFCVQEDAPTIPPEWVPDLVIDDSFSASTASDQANVNVTVEVTPKLTEVQAWKLLSSIVLNYFDVLENSDAQTGYLRTAWQARAYGPNNDVLIRTRVILKRAGDEPLRYTVKVVSERSRAPGVSLKDDENFVAWDRLLNSYREVISEMQSRLK